MKLFLKAVALAAKQLTEGGRSRSLLHTAPSARDELNRLIDVAESSGLVVWHDDFCFKSTFWDWGNRDSGTINWGGYGSSYRPANESYFKFQYPKDTVDANGKLIIRKGAKPLDAVKALILPEADANGTLQQLLADAGANPVFIADKGLKTDAIVDLLTKKKCNFLLTADDLPKGLTEALDKAAEAKNYFFTLPVGRLLPLLVKPKRAPVVRGPKAPPAFADKDDAKAFTKLKKLLTSQKFEEIDQAIALLPGLPGVCDKLLEGISLAKGITAWTNDGKAWTANYDRPVKWGDNGGKLPCNLTVQGQGIRLAEIPKNDLFNSSETKRYALFSVINAAPDDCAPAKAIREGLLALYWRDDRLPPLSKFTGLRHLYLDGCNGNESIGGITSLVFASHGYKQGLVLDWILPIKSLKRLEVTASLNYTDLREFLKKASFPSLEELVWPTFDKVSPAIPGTLRDVTFGTVDIPHSRIQELLQFPKFRANQLYVKTGEEDDNGNKSNAAGKDAADVIPKIVPVKDRGEALSVKELAALKKLLRDDSPETVLQGLKILGTATPATIDALLEKSTATWGWQSEGQLGGNTRLGGPFFDSLKRTDLGEAVRINLLSLASPGCRPADDIRKVIREIELPKAVVPIDVSGFPWIRRLRIVIDPSKSTENWITGMEKLTSLRKLELKLSGDDIYGKLTKAAPLSIQPPESVTEMRIEFGYKEVKVKPDFITVSPNLRKLELNGFGPLQNIALLKGIDPSKLEELYVESSYSNKDLLTQDLTCLAPFVNLISISGCISGLKTLKGVSLLKKLRELDLKEESLEDISELSQLSLFETLGLNSYSKQKLTIGSLAAIASAKALKFGGHQVTDPESLLKFSPKTELSIMGLDFRKE